MMASVKALRQTANQTLLEIVIKDTGVGIPSDKLRMILP